MTDTDGSSYDLQQFSVLLVDDEPNMRRLVNDLLRVLGISSVQVARDGSQALAVLRTFQPDFIITDWRMSPMDGLQFVSEVRKLDLSQNPFVPIIMLSGYTEAWRVKKARDCGINLFVAKPISAETLATYLVKLIEDPRPFVRTQNYCGPDRRWKEDVLPARTSERRGRVRTTHWEPVPKDSQSSLDLEEQTKTADVEFFFPAGEPVESQSTRPSF